MLSFSWMGAAGCRLDSLQERVGNIAGWICLEKRITYRFMGLDVKLNRPARRR
jgi:hypothetical protein